MGSPHLATEPLADVPERQAKSWQDYDEVELIEPHHREEGRMKKSMSLTKKLIEEL